MCIHKQLKSVLDEMNSLYPDDTHGFVHDMSILIIECEEMDSEDTLIHFKDYVQELKDLSRE